MSVFNRMFGRPEPSPAVQPLVPNPAAAARTPAQKVDFHIRRFSLALQQCENPAKREELARNLAYWQAIKAANAALEGDS